MLVLLDFLGGSGVVVASVSTTDCIFSENIQIYIHYIACFI
jgi:hypothetical protein